MFFAPPVPAVPVSWIAWPKPCADAMPACATEHAMVGEFGAPTQVAPVAPSAVPPLDAK